MDKVPTDTSTDASLMSTTPPTEARTLRDVVYNSKRSGGNYGSLAKSQTQPTFYVTHKVESHDTLQRLALKYTINVQEVKRVNKLWSDAELGLREHVHIPLNAVQLTALRGLYPDLEIVQSLPSLTNPQQKMSELSATDDVTVSSLPSSDSSTSIQSTTNNTPYQDYLSKIDQQIQQTKSSLKSLDITEIYRAPPSNNDTTTSPQKERSTMVNNERHTGPHHLSDNSVFVNIPTQNSRDKHVSAALKRIEQEKEDFHEL